MNPQLTINWKRAQELIAQRDSIDSDLTSLQEELRHLSAAVNKKIATKELVVADLNKLQADTAKLVASGEWVLKEVPVNTLSGVATGASVAVISKTLHENAVWNFVKEKLAQLWNFFFNRPKKDSQSVTPVSQPDSSSKAS